MASAAFDFAPCLPPDCRRPRRNGPAFRNTISSAATTMPTQLPVDELIAAADAVLEREGATLATYGLDSGPLGYRPLREFLVAKLERDAGIACTRRRDPDHLRLAAGARPRQRHPAGARRHRPDRGGNLRRRAHGLRGSASTRSGFRSTTRAYASTRSRPRSSTTSAAASAPKYIYTIPTVQNPTGTIMRRAAPPRAAAARAPLRRADLRGRLLRGSDLGRPPPACALRHERARRRHPHRLVLQVGRAGAAGRLHRRRLGRALAHARAQDRRRLRRAGADGARRILQPAISTTMSPS